MLGCSGSIGGQLRTTALLLDHDVLIDAGTGVGALSLDELCRIDHVFLTHSHLDHIAFIPLMLDSVIGRREHPLIIPALPETLETLQLHIFNWKVWPDFSQIPDSQHPYMRYQSIEIGEVFMLNGRAISPVPANHVVLQLDNNWIAELLAWYSQVTPLLMMIFGEM